MLNYCFCDLHLCHFSHLFGLVAKPFVESNQLVQNIWSDEILQAYSSFLQYLAERSKEESLCESKF